MSAWMRVTSTKPAAALCFAALETRLMTSPTRPASLSCSTSKRWRLAPHAFWCSEQSHVVLLLLLTEGFVGHAVRPHQMQHEHCFVMTNCAVSLRVLDSALSSCVISTLTDMGMLCKRQPGLSACKVHQQF